MPLERAPGEPYIDPADPRFLVFPMRSGNTKVTCRAECDAIMDAFGGVAGDCLQVFHQYRHTIEDIASDKFDSGHGERGPVILTSREIDPEGWGG